MTFRYRSHAYQRSVTNALLSNSYEWPAIDLLTKIECLHRVASSTIDTKIDYVDGVAISNLKH